MKQGVHTKGKSSLTKQGQIRHSQLSKNKLNQGQVHNRQDYSHFSSNARQNINKIHARMHKIQEKIHPRENQEGYPSDEPSISYHHPKKATDFSRSRSGSNNSEGNYSTKKIITKINSKDKSKQYQKNRDSKVSQMSNNTRTKTNNNSRFSNATNNSKSGRKQQHKVVEKGQSIAIEEESEPYESARQTNRLSEQFEKETARPVKSGTKGSMRKDH